MSGIRSVGLLQDSFLGFSKEFHFAVKSRDTTWSIGVRSEDMDIVESITLRYGFQPHHNKYVHIVFKKLNVFQVCLKYSSISLRNLQRLLQCKIGIMKY